MEVADSSLSTDCGEKAALYAEAGIADYWVVDIPGRSLIIHRDPEGNTYRDVRTLRENESITPICDPTTQLVVRDLFSLF